MKKLFILAVIAALPVIAGCTCAPVVEPQPLCPVVQPAVVAAQPVVRPAVQPACPPAVEPVGGQITYAQPIQVSGVNGVVQYYNPYIQSPYVQSPYIQTVPAQ